MKLLVKMCVILPCALLAASVSAQTQESGGGDAVILDTGGFWRLYYTHKLPVEKTAEGLKPVEYGPQWLNRETPPPPLNWTAPDFDDHGWRWNGDRCVDHWSAGG